MAAECTEKKINSTEVPGADTRQSRILLWSPKGAGEHYNGPGMATYRLYKERDPSNLSVSLAHGTSSQTHTPLFEKEYQLGHYSSGAFSQIRFLIEAKRWLTKNITRYDLFHGVTSFHACVLPAFWSEQAGIPAVLRVARHEGDLAEKPGLRRLLGLARKRQTLVRRLSGMIAISSAIDRELQSYQIPCDNIAVIPNGVDVERFRPEKDSVVITNLRKQLGWRDITTILFVGGINQRKQPAKLARAFAALVRRGYEAQLVFVGPTNDFEYRREIEQFCTESGIQDFVIWHGFTNEVSDVYRASDIYVLPSTGEGMPNALLEAMASGLAAVSTSVSGATDAIIDGETGFLIEDSVEALTGALERYLQEEEMRWLHGAQARTRISEFFSVESVFNAHLRLFDSIFRGNGVPRDASLLS